MLQGKALPGAQGVKGNSAHEPQWYTGAELISVSARSIDAILE